MVLSPIQKLATHSDSVPFKAMILAAGRGERMRPLTDTMPKPLLQAGGKALIEYHLERLALAGFKDIVINHAHLGSMIEDALGDGQQYGVNIEYSPEAVALETAGGIVQAMPLLADQSVDRPFLVVNGDIYSELDFAELIPKLDEMQRCPWHYLAYVVLVDNPPHHPQGDFSLVGDKVTLLEEKKLTFSGIGLYHPKFFGGIKTGVATKLVTRLHQAIKAEAVSGDYFSGRWIDVGTPDRLEALNQQLGHSDARK